jgi:hypothetical protein
MAAYNESLTIEQGTETLRVCEGLRVARVWRSLDHCIVLEIGRLRRETLRLASRPKPLRTMKGQIACLIESDWRVEKPRSIQFGSGFSDRRIDRLLKSLIGRRIVGMSLSGRLPELRIELDDGRAISTFTDWCNQPQWHVGFHDPALFNLRALPSGADIEPWMCFEKGRVRVQYCYDERQPVERKFIQRLARA